MPRKSLGDSKSKPLDGVVVFIEARCVDGSNASEAIGIKMKNLGAKVASRRFQPEILTHLIWSNGDPQRIVAAKLHGVPVVTPLWANRCVEIGGIAPPEAFQVSTPSFDERKVMQAAARKMKKQGAVILPNAQRALHSPDSPFFSSSQRPNTSLPSPAEQLKKRKGRPNSEGATEVAKTKKIINPEQSDGPSRRKSADAALGSKEDSVSPVKFAQGKKQKTEKVQHSTPLQASKFDFSDDESKASQGTLVSGPSRPQTPVSVKSFDVSKWSGKTYCSSGRRQTLAMSQTQISPVGRGSLTPTQISPLPIHGLVNQEDEVDTTLVAEESALHEENEAHSPWDCSSCFHTNTRTSLVCEECGGVKDSPVPSPPGGTDCEPVEALLDPKRLKLALEATSSGTTVEAAEGLLNLKASSKSKKGKNILAERKKSLKEVPVTRCSPRLSSAFAEPKVRSPQKSPKQGKLDFSPSPQNLKGKLQKSPRKAAVVVQHSPLKIVEKHQSQVKHVSRQQSPTKIEKVCRSPMESAETLNQTELSEMPLASPNHRKVPKKGKVKKWLQTAEDLKQAELSEKPLASPKMSEGSSKASAQPGQSLPKAKNSRQESIGFSPSPQKLEETVWKSPRSAVDTQKSPGKSTSKHASPVKSAAAREQSPRNTTVSHHSPMNSAEALEWTELNADALTIPKHSPSKLHLNAVEVTHRHDRSSSKFSGQSGLQKLSKHSAAGNSKAAFMETGGKAQTVQREQDNTLQKKQKDSIKAPALLKHTHKSKKRPLQEDNAPRAPKKSGKTEKGDTKKKANEEPVNMALPSDEKLVLAFTAMGQEQRNLLAAVAESLSTRGKGKKKNIGGHFVKVLGAEVPPWTECTHVVVPSDAPKHKRTLKIHFALCRGTPIVQESWIYSCLDSQKMLNCSDFIPEWYVSGERKSILQGQIVHLGPNSDPPIETLHKLVVAAGGKISKKIRGSSLCLVKDEKGEGIKWYSEQVALGGVPCAELLQLGKDGKVLATQWLFDSIEKGTPIDDVTSYAIGLESEQANNLGSSPSL